MDLFHILLVIGCSIYLGAFMYSTYRNGVREDELDNTIADLRSRIETLESRSQ